MSTLTGDEFKVHLYLVNRAQMQSGLKIGLTITELARQTNLSTNVAVSALTSLEVMEYIRLEKTKRKNVFSLRSLKGLEEHEVVTPIPFTFDDTDETKLKTLEAELLRLKVQYEQAGVGVQSTLRNVIKGDKRELIIEIEGDLGRGLTTNEAFLLGEILRGFGTERAKKAWRGKAHAAKNPIPALYAILNNGALGSGAKEKAATKFSDRELEVLQ